MDTAPLLQLGLSPNESRVYVALLKHRFTTVGPLITDTKLHRQLVYQALEQLEEKRLVTTVVKNNRKNYQANSPKELLRRAQTTVDLTEKLLPELLRLHAKGEERMEVQILYGAREFFQNLCDLILAAKQGDRILRIIGGASDHLFYEALGSQYDEYLALQAKQKVEKRVIVPQTASSEFLERFKREQRSTLRTMPVGLSSPTYTRITQEMVTIELYATEPMVIQIRNSLVAKSYIEHFDFLWSQSVPS